MKKVLGILLVMALPFMTGCTSVETGHVGVRVWPNGQIDAQELQPGYQQTVMGSVRHYVANDISWTLSNLQPQTRDKVQLKDMDLTYTYSVEPSKIVEMITRYKGRDARDAEGSYYPLALYVENVMTNSVTDVIIKYDALDVGVNKELIKNEILAKARESLQKEGFNGVIKVDQVFIKNMLPPDPIVASAQEVINAQNRDKAKTIEIDIARKEAERLSLLANNSKNVEYMQAKAMADIAEGIKDGQVQTIVVPWDFKGMVNIGSK